ncbi:MAG: HDOD domain-containing protein [Desulfomonilia bacterium]
MAIVPTGGMEVRSAGELKAFLGSCVGLALYDAKNMQGGLLHILLPEPVCSIPDSHSSYYATTGIPLFLEMLQQSGSKIEDLVAHIAGGALVDPSSRQELNLNIGGRSIEITLKYMTKYRIPIKRMEASGVIPLSISLDTATGTCRIELILGNTPAETPVPEKPTLDQIRKTIDWLLPVPQIAVSIAGMISNDMSDFGQIAQEIKKDQVLSAKVLQMCNSSYMGLPSKIDSVDQAIKFLGSKTLLQMVVTAQTEQFLRSSERGYSLSRGGMFHHSFATARLCEKIARDLKITRPDIAYTSGLLHDIGKVVLDQYIADVLPLFYRMIQEQPEDSSIIERKLLGIDHNQAGLLLAESWNLPDVIKDVILFHHSPNESQDNKDLVHLVYIADVFTHNFLSGMEIEHMDGSGLQKSLRALNMEPASVFRHMNILAEAF